MDSHNGAMKFIYHDGGRKDAGFNGACGDCVTRAMAIALDLPYLDVYNLIKKLTGETPRNGVVKSGLKTIAKWLETQGWHWTPTMTIGSGCQVHLRTHDLPSGRLICRVSKHWVCVIDGVIYDTFDPSRNGQRCVYGYFSKN